MAWMSSVSLSIYLLVDVWVVSSAVTSSAACVDVEGTLIGEPGAPGSVTHSLSAQRLPSLSLSVRFSNEKQRTHGSSGPSSSDSQLSVFPHSSSTPRPTPSHGTYSDSGGWAWSGQGALVIALPRPHSGAPRRKSLLLISSSDLRLRTSELARTASLAHESPALLVWGSACVPQGQVSLPGCCSPTHLGSRKLIL